MSDGAKPPSGGGPKKPLPSATIIGLSPMDKPPAPQAPAKPVDPPAAAAPPPAAPPPAAPPATASPAGAPPAKRTTLPPPIRGPHAAGQPLVPPRPSQPPAAQPAPSQPGSSNAPHAAPSHAAPSMSSAPHAAPSQPGSSNAPHAAPSQPGSSNAPHAAPSHAAPSMSSAPHAAPIAEQPSGPTAPFGAATGPHANPYGAPAGAPPPSSFGASAPPPAAPPPSSFGASAPPPAAPSPSSFGASAPPPSSFSASGQQPSFGASGQQPSFGASGQQPSFGASGQQPSFGASGQQPSFGGDPMFAQSPPAMSFGGGAGDMGAGASFDSIEAPGSKFVAFLKISARRAFRLRIEPSEVLPSERTTLENSSPPIVDRNLQAFLAWRRSVLFLVASALIPLTIIGVIDALQSRKFTPIFFVRGAPALAEGVFAWVCWSQLKKWSSWRQQRKKLFFGWLLFMLMPFVVFVYPLRTIFEDLGGTSREKLLALGVEGAYRQAVMPFVFAMLAMLQLAPKAISLMPGLIRASLVIKLLFPGSSAPGWLMVIAAPLYALLAYVILIIPYQFTGSGWFIAGVIGVIVAQSWLARAGFALAKPMDESEALAHIKKVRRYYMLVMLVSAILIIVALGSLVAKLNLRATDVITAVLKFETNVLILTMIGADLVVTNLDRARGYTAGRGHVEEQTEVKIAAFVSLEAPHAPPPPGPAQ